MRRLAPLLALIAPAFILTFFWLRPDLDPVMRSPLLHFYIVSFTSLAATVISFLLIAALGPVARPRHVLAAVSFAVMGSLFSVHALATPGAIIPVFHPAVPAVSLSSWLTLFSGGVIFAIAGGDRSRDFSRDVLLRLVVAAIAAVTVYVLIVVLTPRWLGALEASAAPWHRRLLFIASLTVWTVATVQLFYIWRGTRNQIDGALALVAGLLTQATVSMHLFPLWNLSWWLYHFVLLGGFLLTVTILFAAYEQAREFRLSRYFLAAAAILTVFLALVASYMFSQFAERALTDHIVQDVRTMLETFVIDARAALPQQATVEETQEVMTARLSVLPVDTAGVYDLQGRSLAGGAGGGVSYTAARTTSMWRDVQQGQIVADVVPPGTDGGAGTGYDAVESSMYHRVYGYAAVGGPRPVGILVTKTELPQLGEAIIRARLTGLSIAAITMGLLFALLWLVVRRADNIIVAHTEELAVANRDLRQAEAMRDDLTHMIVHDLRTPLTAILASLGLIRRLPQMNLESDARDAYAERVIDRTSRAAERMEQMIDDILMVSKMEKSEFAPNREDVSVSEFLVQRLDPYYPQVASEEKRLHLECPGRLRAAFDPALTGRVVENLVSNALKYTQRGGSIVVSAQARNGNFEISVRDDGDGVPEVFKQEIFGKFNQVPAGDGRQVRKGTGLGLAFCRLVVEAHGGRIWVEDAPGGGSNFRMEMPGIMAPSRAAGDNFHADESTS